MELSTAEHERLAEGRQGTKRWKKWGPYLSERAWGTVREDYSPDGNAWEYFPHDQARSRAYRWGEDGLAGISDDQQRLCFALALWNGHDPILKERMFGLTGAEGNHGEDLKEYYFYLDATPTHSYMKMLYKYPQRAFPYADLLATNRSRSRQEPEYELLDTGIFAENRYFDVFVEYAKAGAEDILIRITAATAGPSRPSCTSCPRSGFATRGVGAIPTKPARARSCGGSAKPVMAYMAASLAEHEALGVMFWLRIGARAAVYRERNQSVALYGIPNPTPFVKDGINDYVVAGDSMASTRPKKAPRPQRTTT